jgi:hypothetical protein
MASTVEAGGREHLFKFPILLHEKQQISVVIFVENKKKFKLNSVMYRGDIGELISDKFVVSRNKLYYSSRLYRSIFSYVSHKHNG